jgi:hypothetical protein
LAQCNQQPSKQAFGTIVQDNNFLFGYLHILHKIPNPPSSQITGTYLAVKTSKLLMDVSCRYLVASKKILRMREQNAAEVSVTGVTVKMTGQLLGHDWSHGDWTATCPL